MMIIRQVLSLFLLIVFAGRALAVSCDAVFSNAAGTTGGSFDLRDDATLRNTGGGVLATSDRINDNRNRCDGGPCVESGIDAPILTIPSNNSNNDSSGNSLALAPGDYYYDDLTFDGSNTVTITGAGQVRIHVRDDLRIRDNARINVNGDPLDLVFLVGDEARIEDNARVNAVIYAGGRVWTRDDAQVEGALVGDSVRLWSDSRITFASTANLAIDGVCTAGSGGGVVVGVLNFKLEVGELTIIDTYARPDYTRVNFTQQFDSPPLVFTLPTIDGANAAAHRIRNVTSEGFDIMTLEPEGEDGPHIAMSLNFLAVEPGVHDLPGGRKLIAGTIDTRRVQAYANAGGGIGWETVGFSGAFSQTPVVLAQIQTMANEQETLIPARPSRPWLTTAVTDVSTSSMKIALERSESVSGAVNQNETVAYFVLEPVGRMSFKDSNDETVEMEAIRTAELIQGWGTCNSNEVVFSQPWSRTPVVLASQNTRDGDAGSGEGDGGWLRRCSTSTSGTRLQVDEVRTNNIGDRNRTHNTRERAGVVAFSGNFVTQARLLDHFRLIHDGFGVAGVPETVTVRACVDPDCLQLYTDSVTVGLQPGNANISWSGSGVLANQVTFTGGSRVVSLNSSIASTFGIGLSSTPTPRNPTRCFIGAVENCAITFAATGFNISLADQVSGGQSVGSVSVPTCWPDFQSTTVQVDVGAQYLSPAWVGPAVTVNGVALPTNGSSAAVDLQFDAGCSAPLQVSYADAGEIALGVTFVGSGPLSGLTISGSDSLVFYPAALVAQAFAGAGTPLNAAAPDMSPVQPAGQGFTLTVTAVNTLGATTRAYQPQGLDRLAAYVERTGPTTGFEGTFKLSASGDVVTQLNPPPGPGAYVVSNVQPGDFVNGIFSNPGASYSEVGLVTLYLRDSDYMGHAIAASPLPIGRFIPAGFQATTTLTNRATIPGCGGSSFTYMGEGLELGVQLTARNAGGGVTRNYQGAFARFNGAGLVSYAGVTGNTLAALSGGGANLTGRLVHSAVLATPWAAGVALLDIDLSLTAAGAPDGPHDATQLGLRFSDADGAALQGLDIDVDNNAVADHLGLASTSFRAGRLSVGNAHGSELLDLAVPVAMQFFAGPGVGFTTHTLDSCTPIASTLLADGDPGDALSPADSCIVDQLAASGANACAPGTAGTQYRGTAVAGEFAVSLKAPGAGRTGALRVSADAPAWAEFNWAGSGPANPVGIATFGIHNRNTGVIYQRELR